MLNNWDWVKPLKVLKFQHFYFFRYRNAFNINEAGLKMFVIIISDALKKHTTLDV